MIFTKHIPNKMTSFRSKYEKGITFLEGAFSDYEDVKKLHLSMPKIYSNASLQIIVKKHAFDRWNERVGPVIPFYKLKNLLSIIGMTQSYRIEFINSEIGILDNDIVFTYVLENGKTVITSFYGRRSEIPVLNQIEALRSYNITLNEHVDLSNVSLDHNLPVTPIQLIEFTGEQHRYRISKYESQAHEIYFVAETFHIRTNELLQQYFIEINNPIKEVLPKKIRKLIYRLGFNEFYYKHREHFNLKK